VAPTGAADLSPRQGPGEWRLTLAGLCASFIGIGLSRFAYTPLLPAIITAGWFDSLSAAYLGAANLGGYLAGALLAQPAAARVPARSVIRVAMVLATVAFFASAWPLPFWWFCLWRFVAGATGALLIVLAAPTVLPFIAVTRRGTASGIIFTGMGFGTVAAGTLVPLFLRWGLTETWIALGVLSLALTALAWNAWPHAGSAAPASPPPAERPYPKTRLRALYAEYGLNAVGAVPHMIFLADFIARGLGQGVDAGAAYWVLFGIGALLGPVLSGTVADRIGYGPTLRFAFVIEAIAVGVLIFDLGVPGLVFSSLVVGALIPGIVTLVLGRSRELLAEHPAAQPGAWSLATTSFALMQAAGAYGMSYLFAVTGANYRLLFGLGAVAIIAALVVDYTAAALERGRT
jgi:predicted MFS family arabinose efflux permease